VYVTSWLNAQGYSNSLLARYRKSGWISSVGSGAVFRKGDNVTWKGGVYALQKQLGLKIHVGARTALELQGVVHFLRPGEEMLTLFGAQNEILPNWFRTYKWPKTRVEFTTTNLFSSELGQVEYDTGSFKITISSRERSVFELLHLVPRQYSFDEALLLFEGLVNLRPKLMQELLEECTSFKVRRLIALFGDELQLPWFKRLNLDSIDFGRGRRSLVKGGKMHPKYLLTVPTTLISRVRK